MTWGVFRRGIILFLLVVLVGSVTWIWVRSRVVQVLEHHLSRVTGSSCQVKGVRFRLHRLRLDFEGVSLSSSTHIPLRFTSPRVGIRLALERPWSPAGLGSLLVIDLKNPDLTLYSLPPPQGKVSLPPFWFPSMRWSGGTIRLPPLGSIPEGEWKNCSGDLNRTLTGGEGHLKAEGPLGVVSLNGKLSAVSWPLVFRREGKPVWSLTAEATRCPLRWINPSLSTDFGRLEGEAAVKVELKGVLGRSRLTSWAVDLPRMEGKWSPPGISGSGLELSGAVAVTGDQLTFQNFRLGGVMWDGSVNRYAFPNRQWNIRWQAKEADLTPWNFLLNKVMRGGQAWGGIVTGQGSWVRGKEDRLEATTAWKNLKVNGWHVPNGEGEITASSAEWRIMTQGDLGVWSGTGAGFFQTLSRLEWGPVEAGAWASLNNGGFIKGTFSGQWEPTPSTGVFMGRGHWRGEEVCWGDHQLRTPIWGRVTVDRDAWTVTGEPQGFSARINRRDEGWVLERFRLDTTRGLSVLAEGRLDTSSGALDGQVRVSGLSVREIPPLLARFPLVSGGLNFSGSLSGTWQAPRASGTFSVDALQLTPEGSWHGARGEAQWDSRGVSIAAEVDHLWFFKVAGSGKNLSMSTRLEKVPLNFLGELTGVPGPWRGVLSGSWEVFHSTAGWSGQSQLQADKLHWRGIELNTLTLSGDWNPEGINSLRLKGRQAEGEFSVEGAGVVQGPRLTLEMSWQAKGVQGPSFTIQGKGTSTLQWEGGWRPRHAQWTGEVLEVSGQDLSPATLTYAVEGSTLSLVGRLRDWLEVRWSLGPEGQGSGQWRASLDAQEGLRLCGISGVKDWGGRWLAEGEIAGEISQPVSPVRFSWDGGSWRDATFSLEGTGDLSLSGWRVHARGHSAPRGELGLEGEGIWGTNRDSSSTLEVNLKRWPLAWAVKALGGPAIQSAEVNGTLKGREKAGRREASLDLAGLWQARDERPVQWLLGADWNGSTATLREARAWGPGADLRVAKGGVITFENGLKGKVHFRTDLRNLRAGPLLLFGGLEVAGQWEASQGLRLSGQTTARTLWINQLYLDQPLTRFDIAPGHCRFMPVSEGEGFSGGVDYSHFPQIRLENLEWRWQGRRRLAWNGEVGPAAWAFTLDGWDLEAQALVDAVDWDVTLQGPVETHLTATGTGATPLVKGMVHLGKGRLSDLPFDDLSMAVQWRGNNLLLKEIKVVRRKGFEVAGEAEIDLTPEDGDETSLHLTVSQGRLNVLRDLWSGCRDARGSFEGEFNIHPTTDGPRGTGLFVIRDGRWRATNYFKSVRDFQVILRYEGQRLWVDRFTGRVGEGRLGMTGSVGLRGLNVEDYQLTIDSLGEKGIRLEIPDLSLSAGPVVSYLPFFGEKLEGASQGEPVVHLTVQGTGDQPLVSGSIRLENTQFTYPPASKKPSGHRMGWIARFLHKAFYDLDFQTGSNTWYRNEFVNVQVKGAVRLQGSMRGSWLATGRVESEQGVVSYLGQNFTVTQAVMEFPKENFVEGAPMPDPYLSGRVERDLTIMDARGFPVPDKVVMTLPRSVIGELKPAFTSQARPDLRSDQVAQRAFGFSSDQPLSSEERDKLLRGGLVQLLGSAASPAISRIAHAFGINVLYPIYDSEAASVTPPVTAASVAEPRPAARGFSNYLEGTGLNVGLRLTDRLFGNYRFTWDRSQQLQDVRYFHDEVELVYRLIAPFYLRGSTELDSQRLLGTRPNQQLLLESRWKFGRRSRRAPATVSPTPVP